MGLYRASLESSTPTASSEGIWYPKTDGFLYYRASTGVTSEVPIALLNVTNPNNPSLNIGTGALTAGAANVTTLSASGEISTVGWTDYSGTSTVVGWSSTTTKKIYYKKIGKLVFVNFQIEGTSNATSASFTVPYISEAAIFPSISLLVQDNSVTLTTPGRIYLPASTTEVDLSKDAAGGVFTNSGAKSVLGQFWYEATS